MLELLRGCGWPRVGGRRGSSAGTRAGVDGRCFRTSEALYIAWIRAVASACLVDDWRRKRAPALGPDGEQWPRRSTVLSPGVVMNYGPCYLFWIFRMDGAIPACFFIPSYRRRHTVPATHRQRLALSSTTRVRRGRIRTARRRRGEGGEGAADLYRSVSHLGSHLRWRWRRWTTVVLISHALSDPPTPAAPETAPPSNRPPWPRCGEEGERSRPSQRGREHPRSGRLMLLALGQRVLGGAFPAADEPRARPGRTVSGSLLVRVPAAASPPTRSPSSAAVRFSTLVVCLLDGSSGYDLIIRRCCVGRGHRCGPGGPDGRQTDRTESMGEN